MTENAIKKQHLKIFFLLQLKISNGFSTILTVSKLSVFLLLLPIIIITLYVDKVTSIINMSTSLFRVSGLGWKKQKNLNAHMSPKRGPLGSTGGHSRSVRWPLLCPSDYSCTWRRSCFHTLGVHQVPVKATCESFNPLELKNCMVKWQQGCTFSEESDA